MSLCPIRQYRISSALDDGRGLSPSLQKHVAGCPHCRQFLERSNALGENLAAAQMPEETPAWLHTKIMAKVTAIPPDERQTTSRNWFPAAAGATAIAVVATLITLNVNQTADPVVEATVQIPTPVTPLHPASVPGRFERHAKQALSKEFQDLATDISGARNFLSASLRNTIPGLGGE